MRHLVYALIEGAAVRYVGYTARPEQRRATHRHLHPSWRFLALGLYPTRAKGLEQERWWIGRLFEAGHPLVNISEGGDPGSLGRSVSPMTRARMSASLKGKAFTDEHRAAISAAQVGKHRGPHAPETRARISASLMGHIAWNKGRRGIYSDETLARMSASALASRARGGGGQ